MSIVTRARAFAATTSQDRWRRAAPCSSPSRARASRPLRLTSISSAHFSSRSAWPCHLSFVQNRLYFSSDLERDFVVHFVCVERDIRQQAEVADRDLPVC
eukprot:1873499-Pleurochrysis_carterae.AAC.2